MGSPKIRGSEDQGYQPLGVSCLWLIVSFEAFILGLDVAVTGCRRGRQKTAKTNGNYELEIRLAVVNKRSTFRPPCRRSIFGPESFHILVTTKNMPGCVQPSERNFSPWTKPLISNARPDVAVSDIEWWHPFRWSRKFSVRSTPSHQHTCRTYRWQTPKAQTQQAGSNRRIFTTTTSFSTSRDILTCSL